MSRPPTLPQPQETTPDHQPRAHLAPSLVADLGEATREAGWQLLSSFQQMHHAAVEGSRKEMRELAAREQADMKSKKKAKVQLPVKVRAFAECP